MIENVSDTALWVAVYRAHETLRSDALFHDPFAERLAGSKGAAIAVQACTQYAVMVLLELGRCGWPQPIRWDLRSRVLRTQTRDRRNHAPCLPASVWLRPIARQRSLTIRSSSNFLRQSFFCRFRQLTRRMSKGLVASCDSVAAFRDAQNPVLLRTPPAHCTTVPRITNCVSMLDGQRDYLHPTGRGWAGTWTPRGS
jgi:hypothetical protein